MFAVDFGSQVITWKPWCDCMQVIFFRLHMYGTRTLFCRTLTSLYHENKVGPSYAQQVHKS